MKVYSFLLAVLLPLAVVSSETLPSECDAIILGTGPAAVTAGALLSQNGKRVLLVDSYGITGGTMAAHLSLKRAPVGNDSHPILQEIEQLLSTADPFHPSVSPDMGHSEWIKHAVDAVIEHYKIPLLLHSLPQELLLANNRCAGLTLRLKNGTHTIKAPVIIDCTEQQLIRYLFEKPSGKQPMSATFRLRVDNVEGSVAAEPRNITTPDGTYELKLIPVTWDDKEVLFELTGTISINPFDTIGISQAEVSLRSIMEEQLSGIQKTIPAFKKSMPVQSSLETTLIFTKPAAAIPSGIFLVGDPSPAGDFNVPTAAALVEKLCKEPNTFTQPAGTATAITTAKETLNADIVVIGGGTAGLTAALQARMNGDNVILIERYPFFGGTMVAGGVAQGASPILKLLSTLGATEHKNWGTFNKEVMKNVLQTLVLKSGVQPLLSSLVYEASVNNGTIESVTLLNRHGQKCTVNGKIFIDCTGDGDVAVAAGAAFFRGDRAHHWTQPVGMLYYWHWLGERADKNPIGGNIGGSNVDADALDTLQLTHAELTSRKEVMKAYRIYTNAYKGQMKMIASSPQSGVRQTRQIVGDYVLSVRDVFEDIPFSDTVTRCQFLIDVQGEYVEIVKPFALPYRILLVKDLKNLLMAGRHISVTHEVLGAVRYQPTLMTLGQFAGGAAAESLKHGNNPRVINVQQLRANLLNAGDLYSSLYFKK